MKNGNIPKNFAKGVTKLLHKEIYSGDEINNFPPVTMLNAELKNLVKVLVNHLQAFLLGLIDPKQICSVKGRTI